MSFSGAGEAGVAPYGVPSSTNLKDLSVCHQKEKLYLKVKCILFYIYSLPAAL
jgi:hypothetical protein